MKPLLAEIHGRFPFVIFSACQNTRKAIARAEGKAPEERRRFRKASNVAAGVSAPERVAGAGVELHRV